jgi:hypothetical protein
VTPYQRRAVPRHRVGVDFTHEERRAGYPRAPGR